MIKLKSTLVSKIIKSKKDFFFYNLDSDNKVTNYILTNDYKYRLEDSFTNYRVISTIKKENEFITI